MICLIDRTIAYLYSKGKKARAIKEYIKQEYHISIDVNSIKHRIKNIQHSQSA
jgi:proteasome assembly chaperone (PAC2) family protein